MLGGTATISLPETSSLGTHPRARALTPEQEWAVCSLAATKNLRSLAADFGVSHETVRDVVRRSRAAAG